MSSLYERLGGAAAVEQVVQRFYDKVAADSHVAHFFTNLDMVAQAQKLRGFVTMALGGPHNYAGHDMRRAHAFLKLEESHFDHVADHLRVTLEELGVSNDDVCQVMEIIGGVEDDVLNR